MVLVDPALNNRLKTFILDQNAHYFGISPFKLMDRAGKKMAKIITQKFGQGKKIGIFCGLGNNGGDGFVIARYLAKTNKVRVFLAGDKKEIKTTEAQRHFNSLKNPIFTKIKPQDIPHDFDLVIEALLGVGRQGKAREPLASIIKKLNQLKAQKIAVDMPTPGFKTDLTISLQFPKAPQAIVLPLVSENLARRVGIGEVKALYRPTPVSHKGKNGKLLIIGGSRIFHGASLWAVKIASRVIDLVYYSSIPENLKIAQKALLFDFIALPENKIDQYIKKVDAILIGPGLPQNLKTKKLTEKLLKKYPKKQWVIDGSSLQMMDKAFLGKNHLVTPHLGEFKILFKPNKQEVRILAKMTKKTITKRAEVVQKYSQKHGCVTLLKGPIDIIASPQEWKYNFTGNEGMTKGGTGDVLAGLVAALACKNDLFLAACAGAFINGLAGDRLKKKVGIYFNTSDLCDEIPKVLKSLIF